MNWYTNACPICRGTLHDDLEDNGWLTCFSCARSFPTRDVHLVSSIRVNRVEVEVGDPPAEVPSKSAA
jgi:hypothetical protein